MNLTDYTQSTPLVKYVLSEITPGKALDIGSFAGRNALYLARLGWDVTAIDTDAIALDDLRAAAAKENLTIATQHVDVRNYQPKHQFDVVLCLMVLHFLPEQDITPTIAKMKEWTNPHGKHIVSAFTDSNPTGTRPYLFPARGLRKHYDDWSIATYEEGYSSWIIPEGKTEPERYAVVRLVAGNK